MSEDAAQSLAGEHGTTLAAVRAEADREVRRILSAPKVWRAVQAVAGELVARGTLMGSEVDRIINDAKVSASVKRRE